MSNNSDFPDYWSTSPVFWADYPKVRYWEKRLQVIINNYWVYLQKKENSFVYCPFMIGDDMPNHKRTFIQKESKKASPLLNEKKFNNPYRINKIWQKINLEDNIYRDVF